MAEAALNSGGRLTGITTGLDRPQRARSAGFSKSDLIIVAGRPGMGKSALATNMAFAAARALPPGPGATGSKRPSRRARRSPCSASKCRPTSWRPASSSEQSRDHCRETPHGQDQRSRNSATSRAPPRELQSLPLYIDDTPGLTIAALRTRARRLKRQKGIGMVVVDYLQLLQGTGQGRERQSRPGNFGDQPRLEAARQGTRRAGDRPVAAQPRGRAARGQAAAAVGPQGIGLDRAGRRHRPLHLSRGLLSAAARAQADRRRRIRSFAAFEEWERRWRGSAAWPK